MELHEYEIKVLPNIKKSENINELVKNSDLEEIKVMRALQWLSNKELIKLDYEKKSLILLDKNGEDYKQNGLPEKRFLKALSNGKEISYEDLEKLSKLSNQEIGVSIGTLKKKVAINSTNKNGKLFFSITDQGKTMLEKESLEEQFLQKTFPIDESSLEPQEKFAYDTLKSRKQIIKVETKNIPLFKITAMGETEIKKGIDSNASSSRVTSSMIKTGSWKNTNFRKYDVNSKVPKIYGGRKHPFSAIIDLIRDIFIEMGFQEMKGPWVETAFWCMDSMWIPQDHPARDEQDTFYLPYEGKLPDKKLVDKVRLVHETGGKTGSKGYGYKWDPNMAKQLLLRTHTTATTYRYLHEKEIAKEEKVKYFYIGRVFRNEAIDATHLPEFHQVEGFVMDDGLTLKHLMAFIKKFYGKMGLHKIKFKLTYNPYTESSLEALYYDEKRGKWMELINSGIFRPESLEPYGIKKPIIAWGLGLERLAMTLYKLDKLKDLVGPGCDIEWLRNYSENVRLD